MTTTTSELVLAMNTRKPDVIHMLVVQGQGTGCVRVRDWLSDGEGLAT